MEYVDLDEEICKLWDAGNTRELSDVLALRDAFPDLKAVRAGDRLRYCSAIANEDVDCIDIGYNYADSGGALMIWPFARFREGAVYSDPPSFLVGWQNEKGFGEIPRPDWREHLQDYGLSQCAIDKVGDYLERHPPIDYAEVDD